MLKGKGKLIGTVASNTVSTGYSGLNMARNPHEKASSKGRAGSTPGALCTPPPLW